MLIESSKNANAAEAVAGTAAPATRTPTSARTLATGAAGARNSSSRRAPSAKPTRWKRALATSPRSSDAPPPFSSDPSSAENAMAGAFSRIAVIVPPPRVGADDSRGFGADAPPQRPATMHEEADATHSAHQRRATTRGRGTKYAKDADASLASRAYVFPTSPPRGGSSDPTNRSLISTVCGAVTLGTDSHTTTPSRTFR
mmetsp:Transcript_64656/g.154354  ORF Transcript_64656/g.154354 Transcript_64656/m.154354 type:complete len:200 (+) Transcript_64656:2209-2808(+)